MIIEWFLLITRRRFSSYFLSIFRVFEEMTEISHLLEIRVNLLALRDESRRVMNLGNTQYDVDLDL